MACLQNVSNFLISNFLNTRYISGEEIPYFKSYWPNNFSLHSNQQLHKAMHETNEGMLCLKAQPSFRKQTIENIVLTQCAFFLLNVNLKV